MNKQYFDIAEKIEKMAIIPVIKLHDAKNAEPLAEALLEAGLPAAEITFRTDAAAESIRAISKKFPQMLTGAGTVLTIDQVKASIDSGAQFVVSPGFNPTVVDYCVTNGIPIYPGVNNPTGIEMALERGLSILKFFPAEASGGVKMVNAMSAPYGKVKFMATGGINLKNVISYLDSPYIAACGGSWMVAGDLIDSGNFKEIKKLSSGVVELINNWRKK
ncbi:MAG: bifunctional 4-hydroxy-2-oxoglutarate aldolase/2-dehydro-3-deoxy-phosphogluconate aldolase [Spirochaetaceae bacterium]|nr:bifunctional 4-hydroxy-2-oxoglutarate aldolase/2-dehydro-3-deoxy-phosphogluconate aldolase [Spirochaetaceae bacterium]